MRRIFPVLLALGLTVSVLAACGSSPEGLDKVKIKDGKTPTVTVPKKFTIPKTTTKVLKKGTGRKVDKDDLVVFDYIAVNGRTGKEFDNSFKRGEEQNMILSTKSTIPGIVKALDGKKAGSRVVVAVPPKDGSGQANPQIDLKKDDTIVFLMDIVDDVQVPDMASGTSKSLPKDLPKLTFDDKKKPAKFEKSKSTPKKADKMKVDVAIQGKGEKVQKGQALAYAYVGQVYPDGSVFDSSWSRGIPAASKVGVGALIKCWDKGLVGQKLGSRVILVCPADVAYGKDGQPQAGIKPDATIEFAVDLLAAI